MNVVQPDRLENVGPPSPNPLPVPEFTVQDAAAALSRGHHTRVMSPQEEPPARKRVKVRKRRTSAKRRNKRGPAHRIAAKKTPQRRKTGGSRVRELVKEGHEYEKEHGSAPAKSKTRAKKRSTRRATSSLSRQPTRSASTVRSRKATRKAR
jgi:hypothetical protein